MFRRLIIFVVAAVVAVLGAAPALADGKMYVREEVPPSIPYQRALIVHKDGIETLCVQSKYALPADAQTDTLGWVVPVPAVPKVTSMPAEEARSIFGFLDLVTSPKLTDISTIVLFWAPVAAFLSCIVAMVALRMERVTARNPWVERNARGLRNAAGVMALLCMPCMCLFSLMMPLSKSVGGSSVEVLSTQTAGVFDVKVVKSKTSDDLIAWLNENKFRFGEEDRTCLDAYIVRDWCFAVAQIRPGAGKDAVDTRTGLAAPLILQFPCEVPTYPVALTATAGHDTEILLYLYSDSKMTTEGRMTLRCATKGDTHLEELFEHSDDPAQFVVPEWGTDKPAYLCKFRDTLTPSQMAQDINFTVDADQKLYREHVTRW